MTELSNLCFFAWMLAKVSLLCGFLPGIAIAILCERCGFRVVEFGVEQVRDGQLANALSNSAAPNRLRWATSPSRKLARTA